jgi:diguanylate cyclase (GGDEF)-like protein
MDRSNYLPDRVDADPLTGLPNRLFLQQSIALELGKIQPASAVLAIVILDLDRFKNINTSLGYTCGDRLLQLIATRLKQLFDAPAIVGRWSGDEFVIIIPALSNIKAVCELADLVLNCFNLPFELAQNLPELKPISVAVKVSMGIAIATDDRVDSETLIDRANIALDRVKQNGKNHYEIYSDIASPPFDRLRLENILDRAIDERKLLLYYQPQIEIDTGKIIGVESLLRCQDDYAKSIGIQHLIPIAEETGAIVPIGEWALSTACQQNKLWQEMGLGYFPIAVNLSIGQLQEPQLIDRIVAILAETGLAATYLEVEITESIAITDLDLTISILERLRGIGVKISLDDFGTGHSSLAALKYLPLDRLKIDRLFIRELKANSIDAKIVKTIVDLGHELSLNIVAEGVETIEQLELLRSLSCDAIQGFLFSRPLPATDLEPLITSGGYWHQYPNDL